MMDGLSDIFGIMLAEAKPKNRYLALALGAAAIVASKGRATRGVLEAELAVEKAEMKTVYRVFGSCFKVSDGNDFQ
ncbi:hypothetical protein SAMN05421825_3790 [Epilithonimonas hungarica]|uniref:Uncharacterized protein n=2 Tax=Epilithonimonas hungarica TaxID=454006 RepID=A0A1G7W3C3_9FLAO|nr:hypothetical protein SAMN05421825_3790 [Epilithonimonas hungarica]